MESNNNDYIGMGNIKSYKLSKTLENSIYPLEQELKDINNNTVSSSLNNLIGVIFSGIGTSLLLSEHCALALLGKLYDILGIAAESVARAVFYFIGSFANKKIRKKKELFKRKGTSKGRSELCEIFHKSIINDIVIGISFVDKAEEIKYEGDVSEMYLCEAAYYFVQAKIQMEEMELLNPENSQDHMKFTSEIGLKTIESTCKVYNAGLVKLRENLPPGKEKENIETIIKSIKPYLQDM